ncbi:MAG: phosphate signaling complex PhoU family protein [Holosporales bacterium]
MAHLVQEQFREALLSLEKRDKTLAQKLITRDEEIDKLEILIDRISLQILALRQPVAFDLRLVIAALKWPTIWNVWGITRPISQDGFWF